MKCSDTECNGSPWEWRAVTHTTQELVRTVGNTKNVYFIKYFWHFWGDKGTSVPPPKILELIVPSKSQPLPASQVVDWPAGRQTSLAKFLSIITLYLVYNLRLSAFTHEIWTVEDRYTFVNSSPYSQPSLLNHHHVSPFLDPRSLLISCSSTKPYTSLHHVFRMIYHMNSAPFLHLHHRHFQSQDIVFIRLLYPSLPGLTLKIKMSSLQTLVPWPIWSFTLPHLNSTHLNSYSVLELYWYHCLPIILIPSGTDNSNSRYRLYCWLWYRLCEAG